MPYDPTSIVDYLRAQGEDFSFGARKRLWAKVDASQEYRGTGTQNTALLAFLKFGDLAANLVLEKQYYAPNEDVHATVFASGTVLLENEFGAQSLQVQPGQRVLLGNLNRVGVFLIRATTQLVNTDMALIAVPKGGQIEVGIWSTSYEFGAAPTVSIPLEAGDENLLEEFFGHLTPAIFQLAADVALHEFVKAERWYGLGFDVAIAGVVAIIVPVEGAILLGKAAIPQLADFALIYLNAIVDVMAALSAEKKARMHQIINGFVVGVAVVKIGLSGKKLYDLRNAEELCKHLDLIDGIGGQSVKIIDVIPAPAQSDDARMAGSMIRDSVSKSVKLVCEIVKKRN